MSESGKWIGGEEAKTHHGDGIFCEVLFNEHGVPIIGIAIQLDGQDYEDLTWVYLTPADADALGQGIVQQAAQAAMMGMAKMLTTAIGGPEPDIEDLRRMAADMVAAEAEAEDEESPANFWYRMNFGSGKRKEK